jgi:hypothetical protein
LEPEPSKTHGGFVVVMMDDDDDDDDDANSEVSVLLPASGGPFPFSYVFFA